jgi:nucleoside-diphosphate-sugar epimerase
MKTVFVTGITGLLGANLVQSLIDDGFRVIGLVRNNRSYKGPVNPGLTLVEGSLFSDMTEYLQGADVVIHAAAETRQNLIRYQDYAEVNVNGTVMLYLTAVHCQVKKFIFVSSANTLGYGSADAPGSESLPVRSPFDKSFYAKSKIEAETYLLENRSQTDVVIINPTFMLGALDSKPSSGKIILWGWKKRILFYPPGGKNFVHVKDVVAAIHQCILPVKNGERFIVAGENLTYHDFFQKLNRLTGQKNIMIRIPRQVLLILGRAGDIIRCLGIKCSLSSTNMKILCINNFYSNKKAVEELGINFRATDDAILDAIAYFSNNRQQISKERHQ